MKCGPLGIQVCVLLGGVTTIAVAWGAALWPPTLTDVETPYDLASKFQVDSVQVEDEVRFIAFYARDSWAVTAVDAWGLRVDYLDQIGNWRRDAQAILDAKTEIAETGYTPLPRWSASRRAFGLDHEFQHFNDGWVCDRGFGWPARALSYATLVTPTGIQQSWALAESDGLWHRRDWRLSGPRGTEVDQFHGLPLRPIWSGFLINAVIYAAVAWALFFFVSAQIRRKVRRNWGRCSSCGYDLRGDLDAGCPECGWNRESAAAA